MIRKISAIAVLILVSSNWVQGSLDEILAPLPAISETNVVAMVSPRNTDREQTTIASQPENSNTANQVYQEVQEVSKTFYPITEEDLLLSIEEEINSRLRPAGRVTLTPMRPLPDLSNHSQPFNIRIANLPGRLSRNPLYLDIQVENDQGVLGSWKVPVYPHLYSDVWFAKGVLRKGDLALSSDFEIRRVDMLHETDAVVANLEVLQRHEYSRDIRPGSPLEWSHLTERSLVRKNKIVEVIALQGMIAITMRAKAQQDGVEGDVVLLRNLESNKEFTGEVIGEGRVQVTF